MAGARKLRPQSGAEDQVWLHLSAHTAVPLTCQRCMAAVSTALEVEQWYRFVESEEVAMAEDDESEEDLLVMLPQFDLLTLIEDELLMALPLVPMHASCPEIPRFSVVDPDFDAAAPESVNPFAVLAHFKRTSPKD